MPRYLYTARDDLGEEVTDFIQAPTLDGARYALEGRRYSDIVFHTDDSTNQMDEALRRRMGTPPPDEEIELSPEQMLAARQGGGVLRQLWSVINQTRILWLPLAIWCAVSVVQGRPYGWGDWLGFALFGTFWLWFAWLVMPGVAYERLQEASTWNREAGTRFWVLVLRGLGRLRKHAVHELELDTRLAGVLARNGKLEEMNRIIHRYEGRPEDGTMILGRLAGIFDAAGNHDKAHQLRTQFCEISNYSIVAVVDHAHGLIRHLRRADEAEASLARLGTQEVGNIVVVFATYTTALIALERNQFTDALELLRKTEKSSLPIMNPGMNGMRKDLHAFQAICLSRLGRLEEARVLAQDALPMLRARKDKPLIQRLNEAVR